MDVNSTQFMRKSWLAFAAFLFFSTLSFSQTTFWTESFDEDQAGVAGACTGTDPSTCATNNVPANGQWTVTGNVVGIVATSDFFQVSGGELVGQDLDAEVCFTSEVIDISAYSTVNFSALVREEGDLESADFADVTLIIDGVPSLIADWMGMGSATHTLIGDIPDDNDWITTTVTETGISGSTLQIEMCAFNGAASERIIFDDITLAGVIQGAGVVFTAPADLCINAGVQTGLSGGLPVGGTYSGTGVTDDGNGMTYSFDPAAAGVGVTNITYTEITGMASDDIEVFAAPTATFLTPAILFCSSDGTIDLGGGMPVGGTYSGIGVSDNGNGMDFSYDVPGAGPASITYTTAVDANGCSGSATINIFVGQSPTFTLDGTDESCPGAADGTITVTENATYDYVWTTTDGSGLAPMMKDQSGLTAGTYDVVVTDAFGSSCSDNGSVTLAVGTAPPAPMVMDLNICSGDMAVIVPVSASGGGGLTTLYEETFDEQFAGISGPCPDMIPANCANFNPPSNGQWSVVGDASGLSGNSGDFFNAFNGVLNAQDTDTEICFLSSPIDISGFMDVMFSIDFTEFGTHEATDFVDVISIVDGVESVIPNWDMLGDADHTLIDDFMMTTVTETGISGSTLQIKICVMNNAGSEDINTDNVIVEGIPSGAPMFKFYDADPTMGGALLAGPAISYDAGTTAATSPQTVFVTECGVACDSDPVSLTITANPLPIIMGTTTDIDCADGASGAINLTVSGAGGFVFEWMTGDGSGLVPVAEDQSGLTAGTYDVMVSDMNGCMAMESFVLMDAVNDDPPMITCPINVTVECGSPTDVMTTGMPIIIEVCDPNPSLITTDVFTASGCSANTGTIARTFTVTDAAGQSATCTQTITIEDTTAPEFVVPGAITISCTDDPDDLTLTGDVTVASDVCDAMIASDVWINEIHYDDQGGDMMEGVEVAGNAGIDLSAYSLVFYNGSNGY